jgi:murein DD-endopeptidase MepM/ murein hydrolase activator NlpD
MIILYPVKNPTISQSFGFDNSNHSERGNFYSLFDNKHPGVDFSVSKGTEVFAAFSGIVVRREFHKGMGNVIGVRNGNIVALYAHLSEFAVSLGEIIYAGHLIGLSGETGNACLSLHLHFELRDISKSGLKNMVFNPFFEKECENYRDSFEYVVNNKNTPKTLKTLSLLYFGSEQYSAVIKEKNGMSTLDPDTPLLDGTAITIPNYE